MSDLPRSRFPWAQALLAVLAFGIAGYAIAFYLTGNPLSAGFIEGKKHYQNFVATPTWTLALVVHAAGGSVALIAGAAQWVTARLAWRNRQPRAFRRFHRITGLLYTVSIALAAFAGLILAPAAMGGMTAVAGFLLLDLAWLATTGRAAFLGWRLGQGGSEAARIRGVHRAWMIRSYALTSAAITLRLWIPLLTAGAGLGFLDAYVIISWLCWVPNWAVAELLLRRKPA